MNGDARRWSFLLVGLIVGYGLMMVANPARVSLRDGLRCVGRYKQLWLVPAAFAVAHAGFGLWVRVYEAWVIPDAPPALLPWTGWQPSDRAETFGHALLPTTEGTASLFNCIVTTFPLSAVWAGLFLCNWRGYQAVIYRGLHRRCGRAGGLAIHLFFLLCACAALCKPILFGGLPRLNAYFGEATLLRLGEWINTLSFFFEYLLGVGVQIYLVSLVFAWVRGLNSSFDELRRFALRRFAFVFKWAAVVLVVSALGINLPLILSSFQALPERFEPTAIILSARWFLAASLIVLCSMQLLLVFHNESFRRAWTDAMHLWRKYAWHLAWLIVVAAVHFLLLASANAFLLPALGQWTWPAAAWSILVYPALWSALAGWLLASWVCLFRRCERNRPDDAELVRF